MWPLPTYTLAKLKLLWHKSPVAYDTMNLRIHMIHSAYFTGYKKCFALVKTRYLFYLFVIICTFFYFDHSFFYFVYRWKLKLELCHWFCKDLFEFPSYNVSNILMQLILFYCSNSIMLYWWLLKFNIKK